MGHYNSQSCIQTVYLLKEKVSFEKCKSGDIRKPVSVRQLLINKEWSSKTKGITSEKRSWEISGGPQLVMGNNGLPERKRNTLPRRAGRKVLGGVS